jgi:hypothetical protein
MAEKGGRLTFLKPQAPPLSSGPAPVGAPYQVALASSQPPVSALVPLAPESGAGGLAYGGGVVTGAGGGVALGGEEGGGAQQPWAARQKSRAVATATEKDDIAIVVVDSW